MKTWLPTGLLLGGVLFWAISSSVTLAQGAPTITPSGLNTEISSPATLPGGQTVYDITGGTRPGNGPNLFHSFGEFKVPTNNIANFLNDTGLPTSNILGRVTGGNISNIFGTIQTTNFGNANLFLVNPAGFLFGPNATVNVGGMVTFTSADSLRLADGARFTAIPNATADALLSAAPVAAFGFLGSNPGAITIQGSQLSVTPGQTLSLVAGTITVRSGRLGDGTVQPALLSAPSGQINLVSVARASNRKVGGEVVVSGAGQGAEFTPTGFKGLGAIRLSQDSTIDTSGIASSPASGRIVIHSGQFLMNDSVLRASNPPLSSSHVGIPDVGGTIEVTAKQVALSNQSSVNVGSGTGPGGNAIFNVGTFTATNSWISAGVGHSGDGPGGAVTIQGLQGSGDSAHSISFTKSSAGTNSFGTPDPGPTANGGPIVLRADFIALNNSGLGTSSLIGFGGRIMLVSGGRIEILNSRFSTYSIDRSGGPIELMAGGRINLTGTIMDATSTVGNGTTIAMAAPVISIRGSTLNVTSGSLGGTITMTAEGISIRGSTLDVSSVMALGGTISLIGQKSVSLTNGTVLSADNINSGGYVEPNSNGGTIFINGGSKFIGAQSTLSATSLLGNGGTIHIEANKVGLTGTQVRTSVTGGPQTVGGTIGLEAKTVTVKNSELLSTATEGQGGTIAITSHNRRPVINSVIDATSQVGTDGTVTIERP